LEPTENGSVFIGGTFTTFNGVPRAYFAKLRSDASLDLAFPSIQFNSYVRSIAVQSDGRVLVQGDFTSIAGGRHQNVAMLRQDGTVDPLFLAGLSVQGGNIQAVAIQPDGKVVIGGSFTDVNLTSRPVLARVSADGSLDSSFNPGTISSSQSNPSWV